MIDKGLGNVHACVIHQNIQLGMTINSKRKEILYLRGSAEIGSKKRHIHCILIKTRRCLFQRIKVRRTQDDIRPMFRKPLCSC
jgi:hypothetical protein